MNNPNNCSTCDHKKTPQGGWCYIFRNEPTEVCMKHTGIPPELVAANKLADIFEQIRSRVNIR